MVDNEDNNKNIPIPRRNIEKFEESPFLRVLNLAYQAGSNPGVTRDREKIIEIVLSSIARIRSEARDDKGKQLTWDDAALRMFEEVNEMMHKTGMLEEDEHLSIEDLFYIILQERQKGDYSQAP
jgi:hypothetical protein